MPLWVAFAPRPMTLLKRRPIDRLSTVLRHPISARSRSANTRNASTHVSPTAINVRPNIPPKNKELYKALSELSRVAGTYVNLSRLQLALRGLGAEDAVTRVAVLGLNSQLSAQRLTRLLLADPLGKEETWEEELEKPNDGDERAILLRYGDAEDSMTPSPLYRSLAIPSKILKTHNLEILISSLNVNVTPTATSASVESSKDSILIPKLQAASASGIPVPHPVHKTLVLGEGLDNAIAFGRFTADNAEDMENMVKVAVDLPPPMKETEMQSQTNSAIVNVNIGTEALSSFRQSVQNSQIYERGWFRSGLPNLSAWFTQGLTPAEPINPAMKALISTIVDDVETKIMNEDVSQLAKLTSSGSHRQVVEDMTRHLETWAENSHRELRDELDDVISAKNWQKLAWWKLFWRVDDVSMITSEILSRKWLVSAEKNAVYLAGRMAQAGLPEDLSEANNIRNTEGSTNAIPPPSTHEGYDQQRTDLSTELQASQPWHSLISSTRASLLADTVPSLQALSQRLVLQTLSTTSLSSALSALLYVSVSSFSVFEASAVAALGLTVSLRRMQKLWEGARKMWASEVREEGRQTLQRTQDLAGVLVRSGGSKVDGSKQETIRERKEAREAVARVREALEKT